MVSGVPPAPIAVAPTAVDGSPSILADDEESALTEFL